MSTKDVLLDTLMQGRLMGFPPKVFKVTPEQMQELESEMEFCGLVSRMPQPPIKAKANWSGGLFGSSGSYVEYDYHAPEYLEARRAKVFKEIGADPRPRLFGIPIEVAA